MRRGTTQEERENRRALKELEGLQGWRIPGERPPGEAPGDFNTAAFAGGSGRLHGRYATATWSSVGAGTLTLLLFDWEVIVEQEFADGTAHGEYWDNPVPLKQSWNGTARSYMTTVPPPAAYPAAGWLTWGGANLAIFHAARAGGDPALSTFTGYNRGAVGNFIVFQGACYVSRANFQAPRTGMVVQELQMRGVSFPSVGAQV